MEQLALKINNTPIPVPSGLPGGSGNVLGNILSAALSLIFIVVFTLALVYLIWGGIRWVTSGGDAKGVEAARKQITYAIIGLIVVVLAFAIVRTIIGLLGGTPSFFLPT